MPTRGAIVTRRTRPRRDKVRAPNDPRLHFAIMPYVSFGEMPMTAYLISLALIGLVVVAMSEDHS